MEKLLEAKLEDYLDIRSLKAYWYLDCKRSCTEASFFVGSLKEDELNEYFKEYIAKLKLVEEDHKVDPSCYMRDTIEEYLRLILNKKFNVSMQTISICKDLVEITYTFIDSKNRYYCDIKVPINNIIEYGLDELHQMKNKIYNKDHISHEYSIIKMHRNK